MVSKFPPSKADLKNRREHVPVSELKFFEICDGLSSDWTIWHSLNWDRKASTRSGEADYLLFHPNLGFAVIEVKGGKITVENNIFYSEARDGERYILNPFFNKYSIILGDSYVKKSK